MGQAMGVMQEQLDRAEKLIVVLRDLISPVLGPDRPSPMNDKASIEKSPVSALAEGLFGMASRLRRLNDAIEELQQRIEL